MAGIEGSGNAGGFDLLHDGVAPYFEGVGNLNDTIGQVTGKLDPLSNMIDGFAKSLGLPPEISNIAKIAVGAAVMDPLTMISGSAGLSGNIDHAISDFIKSQPAQTEVPPASTDACAQDGSDGYAAPPPTTGAAQATSAAVPSSVDPNLTAYRNALQVLKDNFATFDAAGGAKDGVISRKALATLSDNPDASPTLKEAADFLLTHGEYFNRLERATQHFDGLGVRARDINAELASVDAQLKAAAQSTPAKPSTPTGQGGPVHEATPVTSPPTQGLDSHPVTKSEGHCRGILSDPNMSVEEKVVALLMGLGADATGEMESIVNQMNDLQKKKADTKDAKAASDIDTDIQKLNLRLQSCVSRQSQMYSMASNLQATFAQTANHIIQNLHA